ncbi:ESCRT-II complex vps25 subunit [Flagelloscypha sp. PMI_526]|nr:ESCRT-II complex vps25 subunit [Flagelloscypha sp. PMI_526]
MELVFFTGRHRYLLPSIHSGKPFFSQQRGLETSATALEQWSRILLGYARHRNMFFISLEDAEKAEGDWSEIVRNARINRKLSPSYLSNILQTMISRKLAAWEPSNQTRTAILYWRLPEEWAEALHEWATSTAQLNTIMTLYDITDPPVHSPVAGIPVPLLRNAIEILGRTSRAQTITISEGEGVRFLVGQSK